MSRFSTRIQGLLVSAALLVPLAAVPATAAWAEPEAAQPTASATAAATTATSAAKPAAAAKPTSVYTGVVINEAYLSGGSKGAKYKNKFVELYNTTDKAVNLAGTSLQYRSASGTGAATAAANLTGSIPAKGYFLVKAGSNGSNGADLPKADVDATGLNASGTKGTLLLAATTDKLSPAAGDTTTNADIIDALGYGDTNTFEKAPATAPKSNTDVKSLNRTNGVDTNDNSKDFTLNADITPQASGDEGGSTPDPTPQPGGEATIAEIQGTSDESPYDGKSVTTKGVVTATYPDGGFNGYTIQTPATGGDVNLADHKASDGLFVYDSKNAKDLKAGDYVQVSGKVSEYYGLTELNADTATKLDDKVTAPAPAKVAFPKTDAERESLESMLVAPQGDYTVSDVYNTNKYGEVGLAASDKPFLNPTVKGLKGDAKTGAAYQAEVDRLEAESVTLDDGSSRNFLDTKYPDNADTPLPYLSNDKPVRVGEKTTFTKPVVLDYRNNGWKFQPTERLTGDNPDDQPVEFSDTRTDTPDLKTVGGDIRLGTFNVLNYFSTTADETGCPTKNAYTDRDGNPITAKNCDVRGAWDEANMKRQRAKIVKAINNLGADVISLEEIENSAKAASVVPDSFKGERRDYALSTLVDALNAEAGDGTWAYVPSPKTLPALDTEDVIRTAFIYKPAKVATVGETHILTDSDAFNGKNGYEHGRQPDAQAFKAAGADDASAFLVVANHFKSKGSASNEQNQDPGDGSGNADYTRQAQADALLKFTDSVKSELGLAKVFLVGDFNAYYAEKPIQKIVAAGYTDLSEQVSEKTGKYTYAYTVSDDKGNTNGGVGSLDHIFANEAALKDVTGADIWNINSVESVALEYSRYNYNAKNLYVADQFRASDHDPVVVGLKTSAASPEVTLNLLNTNDFHGRIDTGLTVPFASTVQSLRAQYPDSSLFLGAGDLIGASLFNSSVQKDQPTIDVLNTLGLKASAVGNHEFDQGYADLTDRVIGADGKRNAQWDYLGANVYKKGTKTPALKEYSIQDVDGVKVGVIGAVTQETGTLVSPGGIKDIEFGDPVEAVNRVARQLTDGDESNGEADVIVAEYHEGAPESEDDETGKPTLDEQKAASPVFKHIVDDTDPAVAAIFNGHTHMTYSYTDPAKNGRPIIQTGNYAANVGQVVLDYDKATGKVTYVKSGNVAAPSVPDGTSKADFDQQLADADKTGVTAKVKAIVDAAVAKGTEEGNKPVGSVAADITTAYKDGKRDDRGSESTLGNLVADSLLSSLSADDRDGAQIGVVNPGGLRAELCRTGAGASCPLAADGTVTYAQANAVLPFLNNLWTTTLTGAQFKEALEQQWQTTTDGTTPSRPYLQLGLSHNVSYTYDPDAEQGHHITSVTVNGKPLDLKAEYRIGSFSFLLQGGDNFRAFAAGKDTRDSGLIDRDAWIAYIGANSPLKPRYDRRAVAVTGLPSGSVKAGSSFELKFSKLTLTSLGVPAETKLTATIDGAAAGSAAVANGDSATLKVTVPASAKSGSATLKVVGETDGTTVTLPLTVTAGAQVPGGNGSGNGNGHGSGNGNGGTGATNGTGNRGNAGNGSGNAGAVTALSKTGAPVVAVIVAAMALLAAGGVAVRSAKRSDLASRR
ncbi:ExeM/NucH family extracellular endonuclease [Bifidobacterium leontopitheci]|uniref:5'-nucleotidase, C-terminal domain-containing protein n=1 Tax=Bifidobacterium leontopitheci TaxID=2650774 RepID=A0A6I1GI12_9BIFI|nr:ExeM/NucH family extracellular endonuclease [Bifidobacterium leontopitheci]KAB7789039.1 5'-nucleotidase, C-terminal domain-containing protein [Bifidobacterium leontopitheci]